MIRSPDTFAVVCTDQGVYYLATREIFTTRDAADTYAATVNESRKPLVIAGDFRNLRIPGAADELRNVTEANAKNSAELHMLNQLTNAQRMRIERLEAALKFYTWSDFEEADKGKIARIALDQE